MRRLGDIVIVIILLLVGMLGLASCGALAAETQLAPIKIDRVEVQVGDLGADGTATVNAHVVGYYGACSGPVHEPVVSRQGSTITVTILTEYTVEEGTSCIAEIRPYDRTIDLGSFDLGSYTLRVNDHTTNFSVPGTLNSDVLLGQWWQQFAGLFGE